jgi:hypothetical protein
MKFGKYKGRPWKDIPKGYWRWLRANVDLYGRTLEDCEAVCAGRPIPPAWEGPSPPRWDEEAAPGPLCSRSCRGPR